MAPLSPRWREKHDLVPSGEENSKVREPKTRPNWITYESWFDGISVNTHQFIPQQGAYEGRNKEVNPAGFADALTTYIHDTDM